jgi:hypothetical protein
VDVNVLWIAAVHAAEPFDGPGWDALHGALDLGGGSHEPEVCGACPRRERKEASARHRAWVAGIARADAAFAACVGSPECDAGAVGVAFVRREYDRVLATDLGPDADEAYQRYVEGLVFGAYVNLGRFDEAAAHVERVDRSITLLRPEHLLFCLDLARNRLESAEQRLTAMRAAEPDWAHLGCLDRQLAESRAPASAGLALECGERPVCAPEW